LQSKKSRDARNGKGDSIKTLAKAVNGNNMTDKRQQTQNRKRNVKNSHIGPVLKGDTSSRPINFYMGQLGSIYD